MAAKSPIAAGPGATLMHGEATLFLDPAEVESGEVKQKPPAISITSGRIWPS